jgi:hypothetical protein
MSRAARGHRLICGAAILALGLGISGAQAEPQVNMPKVNTLKEVFAKLFSCWRPPSSSAARAIDITVRFSFNRSGEILGRPRITYESEEAGDRDRLAYRVAVMETLQRCTPMPFTETMAAAIAGRPLSIEFLTRKRSPPPIETKPIERRVWLSPRIL